MYNAGRASSRRYLYAVAVVGIFMLDILGTVKEQNYAIRQFVADFERLTRRIFQMFWYFLSQVRDLTRGLWRWFDGLQGVAGNKNGLMKTGTFRSEFGGLNRLDSSFDDGSLLLVADVLSRGGGGGIGCDIWCQSVRLVARSSKRNEGILRLTAIYFWSPVTWADSTALYTDLLFAFCSQFLSLLCYYFMSLLFGSLNCVYSSLMLRCLWAMHLSVVSLCKHRL